MSEAKPAAEVPRCTREERDPARDGASTGGTAPPAYFGVTQKGRSRPNNEDSLLVGAGADHNLFAVADGMGGHRAGEVASFIATAILGRLGSEDPLEGVILRANRSIVAAQGKEELAGMGTTVVALRFSETQEGPVAEVANVGDSRAYLLRDGRLRRLTEDHSLAAGLARGGATTPDRAAYRPRLNVLTRALGVGEESGVESRTLGVREGDRFLLCSDGLSDAVADAEIARIAGGFPRDPEGAARELLTARRAGSPDDDAVVVVDATRAEDRSRVRRNAPRHLLREVHRKGEERTPVKVWRKGDGLPEVRVGLEVARRRSAGSMRRERAGAGPPRVANRGPRAEERDPGIDR